VRRRAGRGPGCRLLDPPVGRDLHPRDPPRVPVAARRRPRAHHLGDRGPHLHGIYEAGLLLHGPNPHAVAVLDGLRRTHGAGARRRGMGLQRGRGAHRGDPPARLAYPHHPADRVHRRRPGVHPHSVGARQRAGQRADAVRRDVGGRRGARVRSPCSPRQDGHHVPDDRRGRLGRRPHPRSPAAAGGGGSGGGTGSGNGNGNGYGEGTGSGSGTGEAPRAPFDYEGFRAAVEANKSYPPMLMKRNIEGTATIGATILPDGTVTDVVVLDASDGQFGSAAAAAARAVGHYPNPTGETVETQTTVRFEITDGE